MHESPCKPSMYSLRGTVFPSRICQYPTEPPSTATRPELRRCITPQTLPIPTCSSVSMLRRFGGVIATAVSQSLGRMFGLAFEITWFWLLAYLQIVDSTMIMGRLNRWLFSNSRLIHKVVVASATSTPPSPFPNPLVAHSFTCS